MNDQHWRQLKQWLIEETIKANKDSHYVRFATLTDVGACMQRIEDATCAESLEQAGY